MPDADAERDPQDQAEVFDETHLDDEGPDEVEYEAFATEQEPRGTIIHRLDGAFDSERRDRSSEDTAQRLETEADALLGLATHDGLADEAAGDSSKDEIELVYTGLLRNERGAQASAAHWEAKRLSDEDLKRLGYGPENKELS